MCFQLKLIRKEVYLSFLLCILLLVSMDILLYNYIVLGKEEDDDDVREKEEDDNNDVDDVREKEEMKDEDIDDISLNELFDSDNNDNRDSGYEIIEKEDIEDNVPFILPFNAVPFP